MKPIIKLAGLCSYDNLGDQILIDTCKYLVEKSFQENDIYSYEISFIDLLKPFGSFSSSIANVLYRIAYKLTKKSGVLDFFRYLEFKLKYKKYFKSELINTSALIFVGGAYLKYKGEDFQYSIRLLLSIADTLNIPVMMNAVGIEGYDDNDIRCQKLKESINKSCVKVITTRDNLEFLNSNFITSNNIITDEVADSALWIPECYKFENEKEYDVGINMSYLNLFDIYNVKANVSFIELYKKLLSDLDKKGISYRIYCNGKKEDYDGAVSLCKTLNISKDLLLPKPNSPLELINQISKFSVIVPIRFHSCIIAYSLGIESAGIWNTKFLTFLEKTKMIDNFTDIKKVDIDKIINSLVNLKTKNVFDNKMLEYKEKTYEYVNLFIKGL